MPRTSWEKIGEYRPLFPSNSEQRAIADYLDAETGRIDALISKKRRLVELLQERRRALITAAVDPDETAQDHGVTLRRLARLKGGAAFPHAEQGLDFGEMPFVKVSDFNHIGNECVIQKCTNWITRQTAGRLRATIVPTGSVLLPKVGAALLGNARRIVSQPSVFDNNILGVIPQRITSRYLYYWLTTIDAANYAKPGPVPSMDDSGILNLRVPIVSRFRQRTIADYLDTETARIDTLGTKIGRTIELLQERRSALITAAVTGEIAVDGSSA